MFLLSPLDMNNNPGQEGPALVMATYAAIGAASVHAA